MIYQKKENNLNIIVYYKNYNAFFKLMTLVIFSLLWDGNLLNAYNHKFQYEDLRAKELNIKKPPTKADWEFFWSSGEQWRETLWNDQENRGHNFDDWGWEWQLAWVKSCESSVQSWCGKVLKHSLKAKGALVRSRGVQAWGRRFSRSRNGYAVDVLKHVFERPENDRKGKPLFIKRRILFALHDIGGARALETGESLAKQHPLTKGYWEQLVTAEK